jgi:ABC-2 type transport system permease protein
MRAANVLQLGIKELRGLMRDPVLLVLIAYGFTLQIYAQATAQPEILHKATIAVVDEDQSALSARIVGAFNPPLFVRPERISAAEMDRRMDLGIDTFALDIPPHFQRDVLAGRSPAIQLNVDATRVSQAYGGSGYVQAIVSGEVTDFVRRYQSAAASHVDVAVRVRFNPNLIRFWLGAISGIVDQISLLAMVLTGAALIREREHGTIEHLLVMPVTPMEIMLSKIWSMGLVVLVVSSLALVFVVQGILAVPIQGSVGLFVLATALFLCAMTSLGIALATVAGSMPQFGLLLMLTLLPLLVLSGNVTPFESMPAVIKKIMLAAPNTHFVVLAHSILFRGAGFDIVWPQFLALLVISLVLFVFALARFRSFLK